MMGYQPSNAWSADGYGARVSALRMPVALEQIDPLVMEGLSRMQLGLHVGKEVVSTVEYQLMRASPGNKLPIMYLIDALTRNRVAGAQFRYLFSEHLETMVALAYNEAEEGDYGKAKILRLIKKSWKERPPSDSFDPLLIQRILSKIDPDYQGPSLSQLPALRLSPPPAMAMMAPPPLHAAPAAYAPPVVAAPPAMMMPAPAPTNPAAPPSMDNFMKIFTRASELFHAGILQSGSLVPGAPVPTLHQIAAIDPQLYHTFLHQAEIEVNAELQRSGNPSPVPPPYGAPAPVARPVVPAIVDLRLSALTNKAVVERGPHAEAVVQALLGVPAAPSLSTSRRAAQLKMKSTGVVETRAWYVAETNWRAATKLNTSDRIAVDVFNNNPVPDASSPSHANQDAGHATPGAPLTRMASTGSSAEETARKYHVPKDESQRACVLTGEDFVTFWSDEDQQWMYANAIRPDPNGPIYNATAWFALQHDAGKDLKRSFNEAGGGDLHPLGGKRMKT